MSVKSSGSDGAPDKGQAVRSGYLRKFKTMKKKWFVLRAESADRPARLEYYDSEKKYNCGADAKRSIPLKTCFNINKRKDVKHKHVLALYTKDECFSIQLDSEDELDGWLKALLTLQHGDDAADGETPKPTYGMSSTVLPPCLVLARRFPVTLMPPKTTNLLFTWPPSTSEVHLPYTDRSC